MSEIYEFIKQIDEKAVFQDQQRYIKLVRFSDYFIVHNLESPIPPFDILITTDESLALKTFREWVKAFE
ncbi:MAG: hypothetical protein QXT14_02825 [Candidatus Bathyarchaeia archaeon]